MIKIHMLFKTSTKCNFLALSYTWYIEFQKVAPSTLKEQEFLGLVFIERSEKNQNRITNSQCQFIWKLYGILYSQSVVSA